MARNWCKHYRGMSDKESCEAGVKFASLANHGSKLFMDSCPCFGPEKAGACGKKEYSTAEELEAKDREMEDLLVKFGKARTAIVEHLGGPWKRGTPGASGAIDCPVCDGQKTLRFSRAGYNGHIHAGCTTEGCVQWME